MTDTDWITDRLPTEADANEHGTVLALKPSPLKQGETWSLFIKWDQVDDVTPWCHASLRGSTAAPTITPRLFTSITYADDRYLALADDGTAWFNFGKGWVQLDPLPAREAGQ